jgi:acetyl-CoA synthetase
MAQGKSSSSSSLVFSGAANIEAVLLKKSAVAAAAAFDVPDDHKGEAVVCFVKLQKNERPRETLKEALKIMVSEELGEHWTPREIVFVPDLPRTTDVNVIRRVVKSVYLGNDPGDLSMVENTKVVTELKDALKYARIRAAISHFAESVVEDYEKKHKD